MLLTHECVFSFIMSVVRLSYSIQWTQCKHSVLMKGRNDIVMSEDTTLIVLKMRERTKKKVNLIFLRGNQSCLYVLFLLGNPLQTPNMQNYKITWGVVLKVSFYLQKFYCTQSKDGGIELLIILSPCSKFWDYVQSKQLVESAQDLRMIKVVNIPAQHGRRFMSLHP